MASRVLVALRVKATPERAFEAFTREIAAWWRPNGLFAFTRQDTRQLRFEPGVGGRFLITLRDGSEFEIGRVQVWDPPWELGFSWRPQSFAVDQSTSVRVRFEAVDAETRVSVEHSAWDSIPQPHAARHGMLLEVFQRRNGEWWQSLLSNLRLQLERAEAAPA